ncbi:uncharacterized protein LOC118410430 [Branchiostoma floridae]|uniref:Uncharacterized protein LOC118410430 n=1 Tax=Branchiostoma floridae TaxID=7739 RepID=A0A9J7MI08_BRAFL|nr:uncharacterized protein LOC118410430 [Branchiostoma floridae]
MSFLKIALVLCVVIEQLDSTLAQTNECVGPPPSYSNSTFDRCVANQATGGCNCTDPAETCSFGDQLYYTCNHGIGLDFIIVCNYKDAVGNFFGFIILQDSREKFEACTGSPAPVQSTPPPLPTFPPSNCSEFNVATWPPEGIPILLFFVKSSRLYLIPI